MMDKATKRSYVTVNVARGLNLRAAPEKGDNVIRVLENGKRLTVHDGVPSPPGWLAVKYGNQSGFVMTKYVRLEE